MTRALDIDTPVRIQRKRNKGWKMPPNTVYVGRPSKWGNPFDFRAPDFCWIALSYGCRADPAGRREASVRAFRLWIEAPYGRRVLWQEEQPKLASTAGDAPLGPAVKVGEAPSHDEIRAALRGKNLACFCPLDAPCHADVLLRIANE